MLPLVLFQFQRWRRGERTKRRTDAQWRLPRGCLRSAVKGRRPGTARSEALPNYCLRKITANVLSLSDLFLDFFLVTFRQRDSSGEVFSTRDKLSLVTEVRIFLRVVVYRLNKIIGVQNWSVGDFFKFWIDSEYWLFWPPFSWSLMLYRFHFCRYFGRFVNRYMTTRFLADVLSTRHFVVKCSQRGTARSLVGCSSRGTNLASSLKFGFSFVLSCTG